MRDATCCLREQKHLLKCVSQHRSTRYQNKEAALLGVCFSHMASALKALPPDAAAMGSRVPLLLKWSFHATAGVSLN